MQHLPEEARQRAQASKVKQEKVKVEKCGSRWVKLLQSKRCTHAVPVVSTANSGSEPAWLRTPATCVCGVVFRAWTDVLDLAEKIREGNTKWEDLDLDDVDIRFKWAGLFHRSKRTPGKFMMRIKVS